MCHKLAMICVALGMLASAGCRSEPKTVVDDQTPEWTETVGMRVEYVHWDTQEMTESTGAVGIRDNDISLGELPAYMWVNDDDDDLNGIQDRHDSGTVSGENDLIEVTLGHSRDFRAGAQVTLAGDTSKLRVWLTADRTGLILGSGSSSHTWTYGVIDPPESVFVECISPNTSIGDRMFLSLSATDASAATQPAGGPTTTGPATRKARSYELQILRGRFHGSELDPVFVDFRNGEQVDRPDVMIGAKNRYGATLFGEHDPAQVTYHWQADGPAIHDYVTSRNSGEVKPLNEVNTREKYFTFYWIDGGENGENKQVAVTVSAGEVSASRTLKAKVYKPSEIKLEPVQTDAENIRITPPTWPNGGILWVEYGPVNGPQGITFAFGLKTPNIAGSAGHLAFIQLVRDDVWRTIPNDNTVYSTKSSGLWLLDVPNQPENAYLYRDRTEEVGQGQHAGVFAADSPGHQIDDSTWFERNFYARTYGMYRPVGEGSIWVPLRFVEWSWFSRTSIADPQPDPPPNPPQHVFESKSVGAPPVQQMVTTFPEWTGNHREERFDGWNP